MPRRTIDAVLDLMQNWKMSGIERITLPKLLKDIDLAIGARADTRKRYVAFLEEFGFLKKISENEYEINYEKAAELSI